MNGLLTKCEVKSWLILAKFFFCVFMDPDTVEVHKIAKKGQYPAILTEETWSIKDLLQYIAFGEIFLADTAGSPEQAR